MGRCFIFAAGDFIAPKEMPKCDDYVIAADAGYEYCRKLGIKPDLTVGDFDSSNYPDDVENIVILPEVKDDTDSGYAVKLGLELKYREFHIYGGWGGDRLDHSIANIQVLISIARSGAVGFLYSNGFVMCVINDGGKLKLNGDKGEHVGVFSVGSVANGVTIKGLEYELDDTTITNDYPIGACNRFQGNEATVSVKNGDLLVMAMGDNSSMEYICARDE